MDALAPESDAGSVFHQSAQLNSTQSAAHSVIGVFIPLVRQCKHFVVENFAGSHFVETRRNLLVNKQRIFYNFIRFTVRV